MSTPGLTEPTPGQPKPRHTVRNVAIAVIALVIFLIGLSCGGNGAPPAPAAPSTPSAPPAPTVPHTTPRATHDVTYRVSNSDGQPFTTSYTTQGFGGAQDNNAAGSPRDPWTKHVTRTDTASGTITAQDKSGDPGAVVTCTVAVDGAVVAENTSQGAYTVVTCSGSGPDGLFS